MFYAPLSKVAAPEDAENDVVYVEDDAQEPLVQISAKSKKGKGKGGKNQGKAAKAKAKGKSKPSLAPSRRSLEGDEVASSTGGSAETGNRSRLSTEDRSKEAYDRYVQELNISRLLNGESLGRELWAAQRSVAALSKVSSESVQHVLLKGHVDLFQRARGLLPDRVRKMETKERQELVQELIRHGVEFPKGVRTNLLACYVKEATSNEELFQALDLHGLPQEFNPQRPVIKDIGLSESEMAKTLHKCLIAESVVPAIVEGNAELVLARCRAMVAHFDNMISLPAMLKTAVQEILNIASALRAIMSSELDEATDAKGVENLLETSQGSQLIVRQVTHLITWIAFADR